MKQVIEFNIQRVIFVLFTLMLLPNIYMELRDSQFFVQELKTNPPEILGGDFIPLHPYLSQIPWAGYVPCYESPSPAYDVNLMAPFQQAQFVLSPTLLDYYNALKYPWVILYCPEPNTLEQKLRSITAKPVVVLNNGVALAHRDLK